MMVRPLSGEPVPLGDYFTKGNARLHAIGILGGVIWNVGMSFSIIASHHGRRRRCPMAWARGRRWSAPSGACSSGRNSKAPRGHRTSCSAAMFVFYLLGLGILIASKL